MSRPPYGATPDEQLTLARIAAMRRCNLSWDQIARRLNDAGVKTRLGKPWDRLRVIAMSKRCTEPSTRLP